MPAGKKTNRRSDYHIEGIDQKVTIVLLISFQPSYNKAVKDPYNPLYNSVCLLFSALIRSDERRQETMSKGNLAS